MTSYVQLVNAILCMQFLDHLYHLMDNDGKGKLTQHEILDALKKLTWYVNSLLGTVK